MPLLQNVAPPTSAFAVPLHREEKKKRNTDVFALLSFLPPQRSASSPSVGKEHRPASFRKRLQVQERTSNGDHP